MVSTKVPDCLSVITYLSRYYYFFNRKPYGVLSIISSSLSDAFLHSYLQQITNRFLGLHLFVQHICSFVKLCPICMSSLDFAAGLASSRSSHGTVLNNLTKSKTPHGLKPRKVIARSFLTHIYSQCEHTYFLIFVISLTVLAAGFSSLFRA